MKILPYREEAEQIDEKYRADKAKLRDTTENKYLLKSKCTNLLEDYREQKLALREKWRHKKI